MDCFSGEDPNTDSSYELSSMIIVFFSLYTISLGSSFFVKSRFIMNYGFSLIYVIPLVEFSLLEEELLDDEHDEESEPEDELWLLESDWTLDLF